jgi:PTH1 family peptidyl-tRNA hydrolase
MKLLVGLGNPGPKYAGHRHNIGFMALDAIARRHGFDPWRRKFEAQFAEGRLGEERILALKPQTFMNDSGRAVREAMRFHRLDPEQVIVIYDELDLLPGKVRIKAGGGAAGHNGIRSIAAAIGTDFVRVRLGIGHPGHKDRVYGYVLHDFPKADRIWLEPLLEALAEHAELLASGAYGSVQNKLHLALNPEPPRPAKRQRDADPAEKSA